MSTNQVNNIASCETMNTIFTKLTSNEQAWILTNGIVFGTSTMYDCIIDNHLISKQAFDDMIKLFWKENNVLEHSISKFAIMNLIGTTLYENHVALSYDSKIDNMNLSLSLEAFTSNATLKTYYSAPLFNALISKYGMNNNDEFIFTKALNQNQEVVIVFKLKVDGQVLNLFLNICSNPC